MVLRTLQPGGSVHLETGVITTGNDHLLLLPGELPRVA